jgi:hypothetical protein
VKNKERRILGKGERGFSDYGSRERTSQEDVSRREEGEATTNREKRETNLEKKETNLEKRRRKMILPKRKVPLEEQGEQITEVTGDGEDSCCSLMKTIAEDDTSRGEEADSEKAQVWKEEERKRKGRLR